MSGAKKKYWWASFSVLSATGSRYPCDTVSTKHPFVQATEEEWGNPSLMGTPILVAWKEITRDEYLLHGEHDPKEE